MRETIARLGTLTAFILCLISTLCAQTATNLEQQLLDESRTALAQSARMFGDAKRGAILFHQPALTCSKCHSITKPGDLLGPRLTEIPKDTKDELLIEAVLEPSRTIKKGFETQTIVTTAGNTISGVLISDDKDQVTLRDGANEGKPIAIKKSEIDARSVGKVSLMPTGLVSALTSRQQFLDLIRYLMELRDGGEKRARELEPAPELLVLKIPEYEKQIDHAGMIAGLRTENFKRGEAIYQRVCLNCHGTLDQPGTLPTSRRFASERLKNGSDPFAMYQTLTLGYGMMAAQSWMVPEEKYDVIHYIREAYLKPTNPTQYAKIDASYLAKLPKGASRGPKPVINEPWTAMDYGPFLMGTFEVGKGGSNIAYKGIAVRLDSPRSDGERYKGGISKGKQWILYEHDTMRIAAIWSGDGFIDWQGINFNGQHQVHPHIAGQIQVASHGLGWANPADQSFTDPRLRGRDGKPYGPLPSSWLRYQGLYQHGDRIVLKYTVGETSVLESPGVEFVATQASPNQSIFTRTFNIGPRPKALILHVSDADHAQLSNTFEPCVIAGNIAIGVNHLAKEMQWKEGVRLVIPAGNEPLQFTLWYCSLNDKSNALADAFAINRLLRDSELSSLTKPGPRLWPEVLKTPLITGADNGPFATDVLSHPVNNPWHCQMRFTGLDFFPDGQRMAVCSWDGDVWIVSGFASSSGQLTWQRIASGLFQPLGIKIHKNQIYVCCRDQIVRLHDRNGDGEIDFYECFNSDHQVTEHFHEFAMGLQVDSDGNFYYAKAARHALPAIVPHHGTLLKVSKDGSKTEILANGFRAPNGVCLNPDGTFFLTDQEGHWTPKNRINHVKPGGFYGNMMGYSSVTNSSDSAMEQPVCWITNGFDRSPSELLWVNSDKWKPLQGSLLNFSYGYGKVYVIPFEKIGEQYQGGMCEFPIPQFPTGVMRGRFHPVDGQLYTCGMFAWAGNQTEPGGLFRLRYTGKPMYLPTGLHANTKGISITFTDPLERASAENPKNYAISTWSLLRTANYGSQHYNERGQAITKATLSSDGRTVSLEIPTIKPTWCMEIRCSLRSTSNQEFTRTIHNTIHQLGKE